MYIGASVKYEVALIEYCIFYLGWEETSYSQRVRCFDSITITPERITDHGTKGTLKMKGRDSFSFEEIFTYNQKVINNKNLAGLAMTGSAINFSFFSRELILDFPVTRKDVEFLKEMIRINNIEVFVNSICRRRYEFFKRQYLPYEEEINPQTAEGDTVIVADNIIENDHEEVKGKGGVMISSSGGKESLLSMGIMRQMSYDVKPFFYNESGAHWLPAKTSYYHFKNMGLDVMKVWSNTDRYYKKILRNMDIMDKKQIERKADSYPIQLFIFPVYLLASLPFVYKYGISNMIMGNEFDDPTAMESYKGIEHYFGVYDQTWDFAVAFSNFMESKGLNSKLWSIVYPVFGSVIEKALINEFPDLYSLQRSCHSCKSVKGTVIPCGKCTKCLGVRMFIENAQGDPTIVHYEKDTESLMRQVEKAKMRLDPDELYYLKQYLTKSNRINNHVEGIHLMPGESETFSLTPPEMRNGFRKFFEKWTNGTWELTDGKWIRKK